MSDIEKLRRLQEIIGRLTGDKRLLVEAAEIVRGLLVANSSTAWWVDMGPADGEPLPNRLHRLVNYVVTNGGPSHVSVVSSGIGQGEDTTRRYVCDADTELLNRGAKAEIRIRDRGFIYTAVRSIVTFRDDK